MTRSDAGLAVALVALVGVVASASHTSVWAPSGEGSVPLIELAALVVGVFLLGGAALAAGGALLRRTPAPAVSLRLRLAHAAPPAVIALALLSVLVISRMELREITPPPREVVVDRRPPGPEGRRLEMDWGGSAVRNPDDPVEGSGLADTLVENRVLVLWIVVLAGLVAALVAVLVRWMARRENVAVEPEAVVGPDREEAREAVGRSIEAMLADPDPVTAIIGAYARLLEELSARRAPRRAYEGPMEHLRRVLGVLDVAPAPLERLIRLFERARFSTHTLTTRHRDRALEALREVADDLARPSVGSATGGPP